MKAVRRPKADEYKVLIAELSLLLDGNLPLDVDLWGIEMLEETVEYVRKYGHLGDFAEMMIRTKGLMLQQEIDRAVLADALREDLSLTRGR